MPLLRLVEPAIEPVSLAEAKAHLRVDFTDDDALIQSLIRAAREYIETATERSLITQTWKLTLDAFPAIPPSALTWQGTFDQFRLPYPPLQSVTSIVYTDAAGAPTTVSSSVYVVDTVSEPGRIALATGQTWPTNSLQTVNGVAVTYIAGYSSVGLVPQSIRQAILLTAGHWYENRETVVSDTRVAALEVPMAATMLIWRNRVPSAIG